MKNVIHVPLVKQKPEGGGGDRHIDMWGQTL